MAKLILTTFVKVNTYNIWHKCRSVLFDNSDSIENVDFALSFELITAIVTCTVNPYPGEAISVKTRIFSYSTDKGSNSVWLQ